jgi:ribosomal-protein-alanine N-acetyltransferase
MAKIVRPMQSSDIDCVYAIEVQAHRAPWSREIINDCVLVGYDCRVLELQKGSKSEIISYVIARYYATYCHVLNLCVAVEHQGHGYGRFLLQSLIDSVQNPMAHTITLEVRPSNFSALSLYAKMGFQQIGIKENYYSDVMGFEDAVILEKEIISTDADL